MPRSAAPRGRTPIETALVEEFARGLGSAIEAGFAPTAPVSLSFERLLTLTDAFALGRRDMPAAAARFSLRLTGGACQGLVVMPAISAASDPQGTRARTQRRTRVG